MKNESVSDRILIFADIYPPPFVGGAEHSLYADIQMLLARGSIIQVLALTNSDTSYDEITLDSLTERLSVLKFRDYPYHPGFLKQKPTRLRRQYWHIHHLLKLPHILSIWKLARNFNPNLIYCSNTIGWSLTPWLLSRIFKVPLVLHVHDFSWICFRSTLLRGSIERNLCKGNCSLCVPRKFVTKMIWPQSRIIFVSEKHRNLHNLEKFFSSKLETFVSPPPVLDYPIIHKVERAREYEFAYLGRISPEKGLERVLPIFEYFQKNLHIAGNGKSDYVDNLMQRFPNAIFLGTQEKWEFLSKVKILIVPSVWNEPAGRVVAEALIAGCVVFVSNRGGLLELGNLCPSNVKVFDPFIPNTLISLIKKSGNFETQNLNKEFYQKIDSQNRLTTDLIFRILGDTRK